MKTEGRFRGTFPVIMVSEAAAIFPILRSNTQLLCVVTVTTGVHKE